MAEMKGLKDINLHFSITSTSFVRKHHQENKEKHQKTNMETVGEWLWVLKIIFNSSDNNDSFLSRVLHLSALCINMLFLTSHHWGRYQHPYFIQQSRIGWALPTKDTWTLKSSHRDSLICFATVSSSQGSTASTFSKRRFAW